MKGNKKILVVAILLLLITVSFATYAIYRETGNVSGTVTAANWSVEVGGETIASTTFQFDFDDIEWTNLTGYNDTIAPGSTGQIKIPVDADGSEVDVIITATVGTITGTGKPNALTVTAAGANGETFIPYSATEGEMETDVLLNVVWEGSLEDNGTKDANDLAAKGLTFTIPVEFTARQSLEGHS